MLASAQHEGQRARLGTQGLGGTRRLTTLCLKPFMVVQERPQPRRGLRRCCGGGRPSLRQAPRRVCRRVAVREGQWMRAEGRRQGGRRRVRRRAAQADMEEGRVR